MGTFKHIACSALLGAVLIAPAAAASDFTADEMKRMSVFLSNFTEVGFFDIEAAEFLSGADKLNMLHFGIRHNYINAFKRTVKPCTDQNCPYGELTMDCSHVNAAFMRYFDYKPKQCIHGGNSEDYAHFDGKLYHFSGADGEATYYCKVEEAQKQPDGSAVMTGYIYNAEEESDSPAVFKATARPHTWNGKDTWALLSLKTVSKEDLERSGKNSAEFFGLVKTAPAAREKTAPVSSVKPGSGKTSSGSSSSSSSASSSGSASEGSSAISR